jgi:GT2 family glycosyltransferase
MIKSELTLCICVRDGEKHIDRCLSSIYQEIAHSDIHLIVVNHLSKDGTPGKLKAWEEKFSGQMKVISFEGEGLAAARNCAWKSVETPWFGFIDIDCKMIPGWIQGVGQMMKAYQDDENLGGFGGSNWVPPYEKLLYQAYAIFLSTYVGGHNSILNRPVEKSLIVDHLPTLNVVYRKKALEKVEGFDPTFTRVGEDMDLSYRLIEAGYELRSNPNMVVEHALRPSLAGWLENMFLYGRGRCFFIKHHLGSLHLKYLVPSAVVSWYGLAFVYKLIEISNFTFELTIALHFLGIALGILPQTLKRKKGFLVWIAASWIVLATHLCYGLGFLREIVGSKKKFVN